MLENEKKIFDLMDAKTPMSKYWMPLVWATNIINRARKDSLISSDHIVQTLLLELSDIRRKCGALIGYDLVNVPLVYTQVVTLVLYTYFIAALIGKQQPLISDITNKNEEFSYFPLFTVLRFCFYFGWLKVAEVLINPFGEDDDDLELNWIIDRHIKASYMIVDEMHEEHPELLKDQFWEEVVPKELPYTVASEHYQREEPKGSADNYKIKAPDAVYANLVIPKKSMAEDMYADYESVDTPIQPRKGSMNWFQRQISRTGMGSIRSASTAYSSGGIFTRPRGNSVYANPENGQLPGVPSGHKMSIYDRLVGRRSGKNQKHRSGLKCSTSIPVKTRPRIPTPDVTKEVLEKETRFNVTSASDLNQINAGMIMPHQLHQGYTYGNGEGAIVQVVLSPIQELDGTGSVNNTLHANQPGTAALAQAILSPSLGPVNVPMTVSQLASLGFSSVNNSPMASRHLQVESRTPIFTQTFEKFEKPSTPIQGLTLTELPTATVLGATDREKRMIRDNEAGSSGESNSSELSNSSKESQNTEATISLNNFDVGKGAQEFLVLTPSVSAPSSLTALVPEDPKSRKTSVVSQASVKPNSPKRGEVYV
ncbi:hypothetical protein WA026_021484 [Henosepilachna vigintioctopunctata]|uniref:Bestrophin homolog n=1 Tax=Henosepilachna vigintioctopunctata TaxID=420089 RepID=A0AAW1UHE5_9CUCU